MTGLDVARERIIEIACIITDGQLNELDPGVSYVIKQEKAVLDAMGEWCVSGSAQNVTQRAPCAHAHTHIFQPTLLSSCTPRSHLSSDTSTWPSKLARSTSEHLCKVHGPKLTVGGSPPSQSGLTAACLSDQALAHADVRAAILAYVKERIPEPRTACLAGNTVHADAAFLKAEMPEVSVPSVKSSPRELGFCDSAYSAHAMDSCLHQSNFVALPYLTLSSWSTCTTASWT